MADERKPDVKDSDTINLKVVTQDGNEIFFKVRCARHQGSSGLASSPQRRPTSVHPHA